MFYNSDLECPKWRCTVVPMLLTQTSELAIGALLFLARRPAGYLGNPREIATALDVAPHYTAKVLRDLGRAGLVRSRRGANGGFELAHSPNDLTLLQIVEVCQGGVHANHCGTTARPGQHCGFHMAMLELEQAVRQSLARWTLAKLLVAPSGGFQRLCRIQRVFRDRPAAAPPREGTMRTEVAAVRRARPALAGKLPSDPASTAAHAEK